MSPLEQELIERIRGASRPRAPEPTTQTPRLEPLPDIRAVLFDIYGTLVVSGSGDVGVAAATNTADTFVGALRRAAVDLPGDEKEIGERGARLYIEAIEADHAEARRDGADHPEVDIREIWREVFRMLAPEGGVFTNLPDETIARVAVEYECLTNPVWPMPGAVEALERLRGDGFKLGIVSNAQFFTPLLFPALMGKAVERLGFDPALCVYSFQLRRAKPSPVLFAGVLETLKARHGVAPGQVLYVGNDMLNDIWTASRAGCRTALFAGDARSLRLREDDPRCADLTPDAIITTLTDLFSLLPLS